ncbi:MAG TPA: RNA polymerase sigma factor [Thermoanaerobaculia bacterium]|jgi:RNA polymerase sigma-70 factor (ECF subfamily)|nr:RNA polymerase sigma factor [Thermoanaerobaculia bacterium]
MKVREENEERFRDLYDRYYRSVVSFLIRHGMARDEARDLAQDVFVRVYEHMDAYRGESEWKFLEVTARRLALNHFRARQTQKRGGVEVPLDAIPEARTAIPSAELGLAEREERDVRRKRLHAAISELPASEQKCLLLWLRESTYSEIQRILGISMDAVKSRLHDARKRLRERLAAEPVGVRWPDEHDEEK